MHEMAVAESLLRIILQTVEHERTGRQAAGDQAGTAAAPSPTVRAARLSVGALSCINVECLRFGFEALARGTAAAECTLEVRRVPVRVRCAACGAETELSVEDHLALACGACGGREVTVVAGRELDLETITVD